MLLADLSLAIRSFSGEIPITSDKMAESDIIGISQLTYTLKGAD